MLLQNNNINDRIGKIIMVSQWEKSLNISPERIGGVRKMTLDAILSSVGIKEKIYDLNPDTSTIRYIEDEEYNRDVYKYVEPNFGDMDSGRTNHTKFILFSAPGATGKSALAKYVCHQRNGIYWDLPDNKVAEFSFQGAIAKAVGYSNLSNFIDNLRNGNCLLVIDGFDEAEAGSGRSGIEFFLRDLCEVTQGTIHICVILLARTESALFIKKYLLENKISFKHYEVGYFAEYNAKTYIRNGLGRYNIKITDVVNQCIDSQFVQIKRILAGADEKTFLGYAPVLNALIESYDNEQNTLKLLQNTEKVEENCVLLKAILDGLLEREQKKFIKALNVKIPQINMENDVYDNQEQILRIFGKILLDDTSFLAEIPTSIPQEYHEEYLEAVDTQLPQHPFIQQRSRDTSVYYDFTGTAFRDFVIAFCLSNKNVYEYVDDYLSENRKYCPSQLLIEFYSIFSGGFIRGVHIPLMYRSFRAHAQLGDIISVYINGDRSDCSIVFNLEREDENISPLELEVVDLEKGIYVTQLSNCFVDVAGKVYIGDQYSEARIDNSVINCDEIVWSSDSVLIEAYSPGECILVANEFSQAANVVPKFEIKADDRANLKIDCLSMTGYYKLLAYKVDDMRENMSDDFITFSNLLRRIFSCLRAHGKDTPARKKDFIDNRIVGTNEFKKYVFSFLLDKDILYTDEQKWLYKLNLDRIARFAMKWHDVREGKFDSLDMLYNEFLQGEHK